MDKEMLLHYATLPVPRYTSYPTAVDFSKDVTRGIYESWLQKLESTTPISLYLHVPYCREICYYCGCHTKAALRDDVVHAYAQMLIAEIKLYQNFLSEKLRVKHIHWGGGTPSILGISGFVAVWQELEKTFSFTRDLEHAVELDPRVIDLQFLQGLVDLGINRVSFGIQDVNEKVQKAIGRIQPLKGVEQAMSWVRQVGIQAVNFDLIYGLPHQTSQTLAQTCAIVSDLNPSRIACFGYAHLPARRANQRLIDSDILPGGIERFEQAQLIGDYLQNAGYMAIGIDHFARPEDSLSIAVQKGVLSRNFQGYTDDDCSTLIGIGASSISQLPQGYIQNIVDIHNYERAVTAGQLPVARGYIFKGQDQMRAQIIADLMCYFSVDLRQYGGSVCFALELEKLQPLIKDGLATFSDEKVTMTDRGRPFVRIVAVLFDQFRQNTHIGFSLAI